MDKKTGGLFPGVDRNISSVHVADREKGAAGMYFNAALPSVSAIPPYKNPGIA